MILYFIKIDIANTLPDYSNNHTALMWVKISPMLYLYINICHPCRNVDSGCSWSGNSCTCARIGWVWSCDITDHLGSCSLI